MDAPGDTRPRKTPAAAGSDRQAKGAMPLNSVAGVSRHGQHGPACGWRDVQRGLDGPSGGGGALLRHGQRSAAPAADGKSAWIGRRHPLIPPPTHHAGILRCRGMSLGEGSEGSLFPFRHWVDDWVDGRPLPRDSNPIGNAASAAVSRLVNVMRIPRAEDGWPPHGTGRPNGRGVMRPRTVVRRAT